MLTEHGEEEIKKTKGRPPHLKGRSKLPLTPCLIPLCDGVFGKVGEPGGRGLCKDCHGKACSLIRRGLTTWDELEDLGLAQSKYSSIVEKALVEGRRRQGKKKDAESDSLDKS